MRRIWWLRFAYQIIIYLFYIVSLPTPTLGRWNMQMKAEFTNGTFLLNGRVFNTQQIGCTFDESIRNGLMTLFTAANRIFFIVKFPGRRVRDSDDKQKKPNANKSTENHFSSTSATAVSKHHQIYKTIWRERYPRTYNF